jgi:hypothetical protein
MKNKTRIKTLCGQLFSSSCSKRGFIQKKQLSIISIWKDVRENRTNMTILATMLLLWLWGTHGFVVEMDVEEEYV